VGGWPEYPPQADTQLVKFTGTHVTTYTGDRGHGHRPVGLSNATRDLNTGQDFGVWLRHH
jgi:hypothetical protein